MSATASAVEIFGVDLIGATPENGRKLLLTVAITLTVLALRWMAHRALRWMGRGVKNERIRFWSRQAVNIVLGLLLIITLLSIWFDDQTRLATAAGLMAAGLAFALQRVVTAIAGYFIILRGKTFNVGDRIVMGGVRGDVIRLSFMQTKIMEMGQPPPVDSDEPAMWVHSRQFTGRIVTVSNDKIFDNWLELAVRFLSPDHGTRDIKDAMSREILAKLEAAGIGIASATYEITGLPALRLARWE